jgi:hypothetical protein
MVTARVAFRVGCSTRSSPGRDRPRSSSVAPQPSCHGRRNRKYAPASALPRPAAARRDLVDGMRPVSHPRSRVTWAKGPRRVRTHQPMSSCLSTSATSSLTERGQRPQSGAPTQARERTSHEEGRVRAPGWSCARCTNRPVDVHARWPTTRPALLTSVVDHRAHCRVKVNGLGLLPVGTGRTVRRWGRPA